MRKNLAIVAPSLSAQSETFIEAQKNLIDANVKFYYKGTPPVMLDNKHLTSQNPLRIMQIELHRRLGFTSLKSIMEVPVAASFANEKIDVVLAQYGTTGVGILNVCKLLKLPLIVHFHGADAAKHEILEANKEGYKAMFNYATYIIAVSQFMQQRLVELGAPAEKVIYNVYGPNDNFFNIESRPKGKLLVGGGRFTDKKAPYYTIMAFKKLLQYHPDAKLILAGTGELWDTCRNLVSYWGLNEQVQLPGAYTPQQFTQWLSEATAFVQHSLTPSSGDMEGTPVAILEASAAGLPVIATRHAGIPDVIVDNTTGLLVSEHDIEGMAQSMRKLLDEPELAATMGKAGRNNIKANFSMKHHIDTLNRLINNCK